MWQCTFTDPGKISESFFLAEMVFKMICSIIYPSCISQEWFSQLLFCAASKEPPITIFLNLHLSHICFL